MKNLILMIQIRAMNLVQAVKKALKSKSGEGFVDTAVFCVEHVHVTN